MSAGVFEERGHPRQCGLEAARPWQRRAKPMQASGSSAARGQGWAKARQLHMMRVLAWEFGRHNVRVNAIAPGGIQTPMLLEGGTVERAAELHPDYITNNRNRLPIEWQPAQSVSDAIVWLVSDEAAYVTGVTVPVDAGWSIY
jgi:NAD(P)-dependent dehydrogenase (short-subunit alcohol dehydrogenase family)